MTMKTITLNNGVEMPLVGYGVFQIAPEACERCVRDAIDAGYRSIDTAQAYFNEEGVGNAIRNCGVPREELFVTDKVWISNAGDEQAARSIDESLRKLQTDYIDLLLIHQPFGDYYGTYRAMQEAYKAGKVRAIGLSNFYDARFLDLAEHMEVKPAVVQLETHVFSQQVKMRELAKEISPHNYWFRHLDVARLIKDIIVLRKAYEEPIRVVTQTMKYTVQRRFFLVYLWYDTLGRDGAAHRNEIEEFAKIAEKDFIDFRHITYQEVIAKLANDFYEGNEKYCDYMTGRYL